MRKTAFISTLLLTSCLCACSSNKSVDINNNLVSDQSLKDFAPKFGGGDSVVIFDIGNAEIIKYGNAIHRDQDIVFF